MRFFNFFLNHMVQKYQNEIAPIFYYGISTKTNEKYLKIPSLQPSNWKNPYWMSLYMKQSKSLFNISILTADICMLSITPNMLTKPWNYLKKQIPAVGTHTWTAYIKVTNIRGDPVLVSSQNWLQTLGTILYSYSFHNCRCHSWRIQWMVECQQSIPKKTSATLWLPIDTN